MAEMKRNTSKEKKQMKRTFGNVDPKRKNKTKRKITKDYTQEED